MHACQAYSTEHGCDESINNKLSLLERESKTVRQQLLNPYILFFTLFYRV